MSNKRRDLTKYESQSVPSYFDDPFYSLEDNLVYATWNERVVSSFDGKFPWTFIAEQRQVHFDDYKESFPNIERVFNLEYTGLTGQYHGKSVGWSNARQQWIYKNNRVVVFTDLEEQASDPETPRDNLGSDDKQEEVSQLLESVTQSITTVVGQLSRLQTPVTVPGALPSTPVSPLRVQLPTPRATTFQGYASGSHSLTQVPVPQSPLSTYPRVSPSSPLVPPRVPSPQAPVPPLQVLPAPVIAPVGMANHPPTNLMYTLKMDNRTFNTWYQEWSTHAMRSGANDATKMYSFQQAIPGALLGKLMGISPFPTTLATLVEKARDFDRVWQLHVPRNTYSTSPRTPSRQTTSGRAILTEDDSVNVNASLSHPKKGKSKLTKEE